MITRALSMLTVCGALVAAMLPAQVARAQTPPASPDIRIVCFGDSITGDTPRQPYLDKYVKWPDLLELAIKARTGKSAQVLNRGLAGDTTYEKPGPRGYGALKRVKRDVVDEKPHIAVILISGNDKKDTPAEKEITRKNLDAIVGACLDANIKVLLVQYAVLGPAGNTTPAAATQPATASAPADKTWYHLAGNNDLIAQVGHLRDVPNMALQPAFDAALKSRPRKELVNETDGVHLAPGGELVVAQAVLEKLLRQGWIK